MRTRILWWVMSGLMVLSLLITACGQSAPEAPAQQGTPSAPTTPDASNTPAAPAAPTPEKPQAEGVKPVAETPEYGGTLNLIQSSDPTRWDTLAHTVAGPIISLVNEELWGGDWTQGPAGGNGAGRTDWRGEYNLWHLNTGIIAEDTSWTIDEANNQGTIVYKIRQGINYALNPANEASRLLGGRELTADDVVFHLKEAVTRANPVSYIYASNPELRGIGITKSGPWEVTVKVPLDALITAIDRFGDSTQFVAPEIVQKYGGQFTWQTTVGTGPFILKEFVPSSNFILERNPNYWKTDPIGPGKGSQLPYIDRVRNLIVPDASTRLAALRTGKIDQMSPVAREDAAQMRQQAPKLKEILGSGSGQMAVAMRTDKPPFDDIRVRRAMIMSVDLKEIHQTVAGGEGRLLWRPSSYQPGYEDLYVDIDAPDMPEIARDYLTYNPQNAKQLLSEAGYPNGFKTTALMTSAQADQFSIYKFYWGQVGVQVDFNIKESGTYNSIIRQRQHDPLVGVSGNPNGVFHTQPSFTGESQTNLTFVNDPFINETMQKVRLAAVTEGLDVAIKMTREATKRELELALEIPGVGGVNSTFWWPWLKNYTGETGVGYFNPYWMTFAWIDQDLKKSMGY